MTDPVKVLENRLRRAVALHGYRLRKSRRRDPRIFDYSGYMIIDPDTGGAIDGDSPFPFSMSLEAVQAWVNQR